jgi:hypothetical protein
MTGTAAATGKPNESTSASRGESSRNIPLRSKVVMRISNRAVPTPPMAPARAPARRLRRPGKGGGEPLQGGGWLGSDPAEGERHQIQEEEPEGEKRVDDETGLERAHYSRRRYQDHDCGTGHSQPDRPSHVEPGSREKLSLLDLHGRCFDVRQRSGPLGGEPLAQDSRGAEDQDQDEG